MRAQREKLQLPNNELELPFYRHLEMVITRWIQAPQLYSLFSVDQRYRLFHNLKEFKIQNSNHMIWFGGEDKYTELFSEYIS
jgi:hypothetical protein